MPAPGDRLIANRYRLTERIGSGGMGTVWLAVDERVGRECAVKEPQLPGDPAQHQQAYERLRREARAAARVEHPAAVAIHDVVTEGGLPWIVMELVRGESLQQVLDRGPLPPAEAARIGLALVGALAAAHAKGILHRDVKPANVLIGPHGRVVLTDFGIAHIQGEETLTVTGEFVGSLDYIAPERMAGVSVGPESDLWSLGVLLYAAVEGVSPFRRTSLESTLAAILTDTPPQPRQAGALGPLIMGLLAKPPQERPSAQAVTRFLGEAAAGRTVEEAVTAEEPEAGTEAATERLSAPEDPAPTRKFTPSPDSDTRPSAVRDPGRRRLLTGLAGVVAAGALGTGGWLYLASDGDPEDGLPPASGGYRTFEELGARLAVPEAHTEIERTTTRVMFRSGDDDVWLSVTRQYGGPGEVGTWAMSEKAKMQNAGDTAYQSSLELPGAGGPGADPLPAALVDSTYQDEGFHRRVTLYVVTDRGVHYELFVDMPKGTAAEKRGMTAYKQLRDRLKFD
ncbi:serine/threonine-protein kinase [Streptomyces sp. NBC_01304]|uniref:serine/threonine-protein kinase n=1 Tax=Streptomyces sp. NBC_01304 TaxID=2903818 RepID=UPI002E0F22B7|nr:protein kinase [Streptomyces sp. NBC_01304]